MPQFEAMGSRPDAQRRGSVQRAAQKAERPVPGLLRPNRVVLGCCNAARSNRGLIRERMVRKVAMKFEFDVGAEQLVLELIDRGDREELVLNRPMAQQRRLDLACVDVVERWAAVPDDACVDFGGSAERQQRQRTSHAKTRYADFAAARLEVLDGAADIL